MKLLCVSFTFLFCIHLLKCQKGSVKQFKYRYSLHEPYSLRRKKTENGIYCGCPRVFSPACATNNITYVNACILKCWKKILKKAGPCVTWRPRGYGNKITEVYVPRGWRREDQPQDYEKNYRLPAYERKVTGIWFTKINSTGQNSISKQKLAEAKYKERFSDESNSNSSESSSPTVPEKKFKNFTSPKQSTSFRVGSPKKPNMINVLKISKVPKFYKMSKIPTVLPKSENPTSRPSKTPRMPNLLLTSEPKTSEMPQTLDIPQKSKQPSLGEIRSYNTPKMPNKPLMSLEEKNSLEESGGETPDTPTKQSILEMSRKLSLGKFGLQVAEIPNMLLKSNRRLLDEAMLFNTPKKQNEERMSNELSLEVIESPNIPEQEKLFSQRLSEELLLDEASQKTFETENGIQEISSEHHTVSKIIDQQKFEQRSQKESITDEVSKKIHKDQNEILEISNERSIEKLCSSEQQKLNHKRPNKEASTYKGSKKIPQNIGIEMSKERLVENIKSDIISNLQKLTTRKWKHYLENLSSSKITKKKKKISQKSTKCSLDLSVTKLPKQALTLKISIKRAGELGLPNLMKQLNVAIEKQKKISSGLSDALASPTNKTLTTKIIHIKFT